MFLVFAIFSTSIFGVFKQKAEPSFKGAFKNLGDCLVHCETEGEDLIASRDVEQQNCTKKCLKAFPPKKHQSRDAKIRK
ncbi:MAG TPA: hypothetical protein VHA52_05410 [Candidatus Babeliaceae bacterium]|nr:hypothetical protein [Candidatus Babeliaceae bacterium]